MCLTQGTVSHVKRTCLEDAEDSTTSGLSVVASTDCTRQRCWSVLYLQLFTSLVKGWFFWSWTFVFGHSFNLCCREPLGKAECHTHPWGKGLALDWDRCQPSESSSPSWIPPSCFSVPKYHLCSPWAWFPALSSQFPPGPPKINVFVESLLLQDLLGLSNSCYHLFLLWAHSPPSPLGSGCIAFVWVTVNHWWAGGYCSFHRVLKYFLSVDSTVERVTSLHLYCLSFTQATYWPTTTWRESSSFVTWRCMRQSHTRICELSAADSDQHTPSQEADQEQQAAPQSCGRGQSWPKAKAN